MLFATRKIRTQTEDAGFNRKRTIAGVHFEVKRCEAVRLYPALEQAARDAGDNVPVVLHRSNRRRWVAIVALDHLPALAVQLYLTLAANP